MTDTALKSTGPIPAPTTRGIASPLSRSKLVRLTLVALVAASLGVIGEWGLAVINRTDTGDTRNSADVGFLQTMSTHHHQAVLLAQLAAPQLEPLVRPLAMSIQTNQLIQIGQMQGWLQLWDEPVQPTESSMSWMGVAPRVQWRLSMTRSVAPTGIDES